jgi:hypothetical protein
MDRRDYALQGCSNGYAITDAMSTTLATSRRECSHTTPLIQMRATETKFWTLAGTSLRP